MKRNKKFSLVRYQSEEEQKYKELFQITAKFHSTMDIDSLLFEMIETLKRLYPSLEYYIFLSNDNQQYINLPVKDLEYNSDNEAAMRAYVSGVAAVQEDLYPVLYAPLKGKQGVYGVLQAISKSEAKFQKGQIEFISLLANAAGSALENVKLYEQSRRLIEDLQLINDTSHKLNSTLRLKETIQFLHTQIASSFKASAVGFVYFDGGNPLVLPGSSDTFFGTKGAAVIEYLTAAMSKDKEGIFIANIGSKMDSGTCHYQSLMAVPMVQSDSLIGMCIALHEDIYAFTFERFKLLRELIHHSTLALTNSMLREELERMVITDHLTQLFARKYLNEAIELSMKKDKQGTFIMVDLDDFKKINDTYGHQTGDEVLIQVARLIKSYIRTTDIGARWGGEELAIYLPGVSLEQGMAVAERIRVTVKEQTTPPITISCGLSCWSADKEDEMKQLFNRADTALYEAKNAGKNRVYYKLKVPAQ